MIGTRPDIAYGVSALSRHLTKPTHRHWSAAIHLLRYLDGTKTVGISAEVGEREDGFPDSEMFSEPTAAVESDFGNDQDELKSTSGYVITVNRAVVSWRSKRQSMVATSTCHAEYIAASEASREIMWMRMLL